MRKVCLGWGSRRQEEASGTSRCAARGGRGWDTGSRKDPNLKLSQEREESLSLDFTCFALLSGFLRRISEKKFLNSHFFQRLIPTSQNCFPLNIWNIWTLWFYGNTQIGWLIHIPISIEWLLNKIVLGNCQRLQIDTSQGVLNCPYSNVENAQEINYQGLRILALPSMYTPPHRWKPWVMKGIKLKIFHQE